MHAIWQGFGESRVGAGVEGIGQQNHPLRGALKGGEGVGGDELTLRADRQYAVGKGPQQLIVWVLDQVARAVAKSHPLGE
jgi:hypothetical protein